MLTTQQIQKVTIPIVINLCDNDKLTLEFSFWVRKSPNLYKIGKRIPHFISGKWQRVKNSYFLNKFSWSGPCTPRTRHQWWCCKPGSIMCDHVFWLSCKHRILHFCNNTIVPDHGRVTVEQKHHFLPFMPLR